MLYFSVDYFLGLVFKMSCFVHNPKKKYSHLTSWNQIITLLVSSIKIITINTRKLNTDFVWTIQWRCASCFWAGLVFFSLIIKCNFFISVDITIKSLALFSLTLIIKEGNLISWQPNRSIEWLSAWLVINLIVDNSIIKHQQKRCWIQSPVMVRKVSEWTVGVT